MNQNNKNNKYSIYLILLLILTVFHLLLKINLELSKKYNQSLRLAESHERLLFRKLKLQPSVGWFNLVNHKNYRKELDYMFLIFQYMIAPTLLENNTYSKNIICFYDSPTQLVYFCEKHKRYKLIRKDILNYYALLEKVD